MGGIHPARPASGSHRSAAFPRFLKTHLHPQALPWHREWKYIYLARDGRDVGLSLYNHIRTMAEEITAAGKPVPPVHSIPADFGTFWDQWVETGKPRWDFWGNVASWWQIRHQPNVLLLHYADLTRNKPQEAERIAHFLGCEWDASICGLVCEKSSLEYMRQLELAGKLGSPDKNKQKTGLVNKGGNGRWKDLLTEQQLKRYAAIAAHKLEPACAEWLHHGGHIG
ncbi:MAG: sulfotransferase domain-containing protein [Candidatus Thiothrix singaporensis]|uniref:Sulfotransferase domain-containing protein n=1 Tax=Candidatus Thiothrix singaporensis TaxID=2799669 RepID=A0A7L6ARK6_9GAMM|nr:MAG: sulfotransferase domain-containing protein [Candidatus Thiothrix singaporensis]